MREMGKGKAAAGLRDPGSVAGAKRTSELAEGADSLPDTSRSREASNIALLMFCIFTLSLCVI
jgi:hypothetical protein